jgi:hypothetical protein
MSLRVLRFEPDSPLADWFARRRRRHPVLRLAGVEVQQVREPRELERRVSRVLAALPIVPGLRR